MTSTEPTQPQAGRTFALIWAGAYAFSLHTGIFLPQVLAVVGVGGAATLLITRKAEPPRYHPVWWVFAAAVAAQLLSAGFSIDPGHSFTTLGRYYMLPVAGAFSALVLLRERKTLNTTALWFLIGGAFGGLVGIVQIFTGVDPIYGQHITGPDPAVTWIDLYVPRGLLNMPLTYAGVQMMAVVFCLPWLLKYRGKRKVWLWVAYGIVALSLLLAGKRSPWLGGMAGLAVFFLTRGRKVALIMLLAALLGGVGLFSISGGFRSRVLNTVQLRTDSESDRLHLWRAAWDMGLDHPVLGIGPGLWSRYVDNYLPEKDPEDWIVRMNHKTGEEEHKPWYSKAHAHSDPMMMWATAGMLGTVTVFSTALLLLLVGWRELKMIGAEDATARAVYFGGMLALVAFVGASLFQCYLSDGEDALTLFFLLGVGLAARQRLMLGKEKHAEARGAWSL